MCLVRIQLILYLQLGDDFGAAPRAFHHPSLSPRRPGSQCPDRREAEIGVIFVASALEKELAQPGAYVVLVNSCLWEEMSRNNFMLIGIHHEIQ